MNGTNDLCLFLLISVPANFYSLLISIGSITEILESPPSLSRKSYHDIPSESSLSDDPDPIASLEQGYATRMRD
jgi:hypothetical protein